MHVCMCVLIIGRLLVAQFMFDGVLDNVLNAYIHICTACVCPVHGVSDSICAVCDYVTLTRNVVVVTTICLTTTGGRHQLP